LSAEEGKDGDDENHDPAAVHLSLRGAQGNILPADDVAFGPEGEGRTGKTGKRRGSTTIESRRRYVRIGRGVT
jgi:hypothetical protein